MARGRGWSAPETLYMLGLVEQNLPFGSNQSNAVQLQYNTGLSNGFSTRDAKSIKRKFYALKNTSKPTRDPSSPADIDQVKRVYRLIEEHCGVLVLDDTVTVDAVSPASSLDDDATAPPTAMASLEVSSAPQSTSGTGGFGTVDRLLDNIESESNADWCTALLAIDELAAAREMEYRRERDAQRRQDEVRREEQEQMREERREERERLREERFLALIAQIAKKQD
ncbi:hypothetical protein PI126_g12279 [Phytophthora idaei]|nr:hypothetical protein PI126_g12279 [Phytophthora idaei]